MAGRAGTRSIAVAMSLTASFVWATYYIFVLAITPGTRPSAIIVYPFLFGGCAYALLAVARGEGSAFVAMWKQPVAYVRTSLLVVMQLSVLAATYLTGPVDASLLSLIGDVVATPIIVAFLLGAHREQVRSAWFAVGLVLSLAGGTLTIAGGRSLSAIPPAGWIVVPAVPLSVAWYFLLAARANVRDPSTVVVGQSMLGSGLITAVLSPLIPGGWAGLLPSGAGAWSILIALGLTSFFLAEVLYFDAIRRAGLILPPMLMTGIPVFTLLLSSIVLRLTLPVIAVLGIPVAVVGAVLALRGQSVAPTPAPAEPTGPAA